MVASHCRQRRRGRDRPVSIPFIAGQWSLPRRKAGGQGGKHKFQSPSLRGSGRFDETDIFVIGEGGCFNPLHCGAVVASCVDARRGGGRIRFQSPSLRGSGRFGGNPPAEMQLKSFQSPSLRGSGRFAAALTPGSEDLLLFQSPSLRGSGRFSHLMAR